MFWAATWPAPGKWAKPPYSPRGLVFLSFRIFGLPILQHVDPTVAERRFAEIERLSLELCARTPKHKDYIRSLHEGREGDARNPELRAAPANSNAEQTGRKTG